MREPQRLAIERDIATARRSLYRAIETANRGAYYTVADVLCVVQEDLAGVMDCVIRGKEEMPESLSRRTYLYAGEPHDGTTASRQSLRSRQA